MCLPLYFINTLAYKKNTEDRLTHLMCASHLPRSFHTDIWLNSFRCPSPLVRSLWPLDVLAVSSRCIPVTTGQLCSVLGVSSHRYVYVHVHVNVNEVVGFKSGQKKNTLLSRDVAKKLRLGDGFRLGRPDSGEPKPPTPTFQFLLEICPPYFGNIVKSKTFGKY